MATLDDYALKSMNLAKMTGIMMGVHAIKDAFLLMHTGVGCKYKTAAQISQHDWATHPNKKEGWTQVGDRAVIKGSSGRIGPFARSWAERRNPGFMAVVSAVFLELTGEDFSDTVKKTESDFPCPMAFFGTGGAAADFYRGYAEIILQVAKKMEWKDQEVRAGEVGLIGHLFTRYEADQRADVGQLRGLLKGLGLKMGPVFFSGSKYENLTSIGGCEHHIQMPYAYPIRKKLKRVVGKEVPAVQLPMGIAGTSRWLREVAEITGVSPGRAEAFIHQQAGKTRDQISKLRERYAGLPVAIIADTPLAAGLTTMMHEFGLRPVFVGLRDQTLGQSKVYHEWIEKDGVTLGDNAEVIENPSLRFIREELLERIRRREIVGVLASSTDFSLLQNVHFDNRPFMLQVGFPSTKYHVTYSIPTLGYGGVVAMGQRVLDQILSTMG